MHMSKMIGSVLVLLSTSLMLWLLLKKDEAFFNLRDVIVSHFKVFEHGKTQYIVFYVLPLMFAVGLSLLYEAGATFYSELSIILGILLSILLAILAILCGYDFSGVKNQRQKDRAKNVLKETLNSIVFDSALCLFMLLYDLVIVVLSDGTFNWLPFDIRLIKSIVSGVAYYIFLVILLTLLFIIKQMCKLIEFNLEAKRGDTQ